jgi:opine dehydrogenase
VGSGRGGYALAADLTVRGHDVRIHFGDRDADARAVAAAGGIGMTGILGDRHVPVRTERDLARAVADAQLVALPVAASVQERYLSLVVPHLRTGQAVWFVQGGGASLLPGARQRAGELLFIETMYLPYSARRTGPADVVIRSRLRVPWSAFPGQRADDAASLLGEAFDLPRGRNVLEIALQNVNAVLHPLPCLLNWGRIEGREDDFVLMRDGLTPTVLESMLALDTERRAVCAAAGLSTASIDDIYAVLGVVPPPYRRAPGSGQEIYEHRFIREAVPFGLVTIASAARQLGVATPLIEATIILCDALYRAESWREGRTMDRLGLGNLDAADLARALG